MGGNSFKFEILFILLRQSHWYIQKDWDVVKQTQKYGPLNQKRLTKNGTKNDLYQLIFIEYWIEFVAMNHCHKFFIQVQTKKEDNKRSTNLVLFFKAITTIDFTESWRFVRIKRGLVYKNKTQTPAVSKIIAMKSRSLFEWK